MLLNVLVTNTLYMRRDFPLAHLYRMHAHTFGQKRTNYDVKLKISLNAHYTSLFLFFLKKNSITNLSKLLEITNYYYICENDNLRTVNLVIN
jgi:hypothetical protein